MRGLYALLLVFQWASLGAITEAEKLEKVQALQLDERFLLGGWLDMLYFESNEVGQRPFVDFSHLYLYLDMQLSERWRGFVELEYEHVPGEVGEKDENELLLDRAFIEYRYSSPIRFRMGKFNTPAGLWKPSHWAVTVDAFQQPIMEVNRYIPTKTVGFEFLGTMASRFGVLDYAVLLSTGNEESDADDPGDGADGLGGDLRYSFRDRYFIGLSLYRYALDGGGHANGILGYSDVFIVRDTLLWRTEFLSLKRDRRTDIKSYYTKLKWWVHPQLYLNLRYDFGDDDREAGGEEHETRSLTLGYRPFNHIRLKAEVLSHDFQGEREDYTQWALWVGWVF